MAKRKSLNKRSSKYSRGSGGSNVLNPDTNVFDDEQPYWWRNLENNTIVTRSTNSANFNQTSRRLNPNSSIESNNDLDDGWWKVLEGTSRNLKSPQKGNDLSKKDANDGASRVSESEDEVKIAKKKPQLRSEAKKVDGNAFLSALKEPKLLLIPLEKDVSVAQRFSSTTQKLSNKDSATKRRTSENSNDLSVGPLPKATSTPLERSIQGSSVGNSNSDTEPILKRKKPRTKLLRQHNRDTKKNLFENILMEDQTEEEEEAAHRPSPNVSAAADKSANEPEPRVVENESKLEDANKRLHPTEKADHPVSVKYSSDTTYEFPEPTKPKSRFLRQTRRTPRENLFQRILSDSDSSITEPTSNHSQNRNSTQAMRRPSVSSAQSDDAMNLKLSASSSDIDIIRTHNNMVPSVPDNHVEMASSPSEDRIFDVVKTSHERSVLSNENEKDRNVSRTFQTQLYSDSDEEEDDKASDVTLLTTESKSQSEKTKSTNSSDNISQQSQKNSAAYEQAAASLTRGSAGNKDSAVAENAYDASDIEFPNLNRSRKRSISWSTQEIAAEEAAMSQPTMKSQKRSSSANLNEDRTISEAELLPRTPPRRQSKRLITAQQRISSPANVEQTREPENITPRRSKRSEAVRRTSETENVRTFEQERSSRANLNEDRTISEAELLPRTPPRRQSKRLIMAQQRISSPPNVEQTREPENITPRRSKRSEAVRRTSETENVQTFEQENSSRASLNENRASSEEELLPRTPPRRQSKRLITAQQRISSPANVEQTRESENITPRGSKSSEAVQRTSETENVQTFEQEHSSRASLNENRASSEEELLPRTPPRRQSKRLIMAQQRISSPANAEQTREPENITSRRSKRSEAVRRTSETENVRTFEQEHSSRASFNEDRASSEEQRVSSPANDEQTRELGNIMPRRSKRSETARRTSETENVPTFEQEHSSRASLNEESTSSEEELLPRTPLRRQSRRSTTAQQRVSSPPNAEQTREPENITSRRSKRSETVQRTSETENVRTFEQEHASRASLNEESTSSEEELLPRTPLRRQSKRSTTAQQRVSSPANVEQTRELENITPRRSKSSEAVQRTSETENVQTFEQEHSSRASLNEDRASSEEQRVSSPANVEQTRELGNITPRRSKRSETARRTSETENVPTFEQEHSSRANFNEGSPSSEAEPSARTSLNWQSNRSPTAQQRVSSPANLEQTRELENITPRRSQNSVTIRRTFETENVRAPEEESGGVVKGSEIRDLIRSLGRSISRSTLEVRAKSTALSQPTMESQELSSPAHSKEDRTSSAVESSTLAGITTQQLGNTTPRRSKRSEAARRTSETENVRTPERDSTNAAEVSELEGTLQSRRSRLIVETRETPPLHRPGSDKANSSAAPQKRQKVLEDYFGTNATAIPASQALSNPEVAQEIRKKLDEMKKRELQKMEEIRKLPVVKKNKLGKGVRAKPNQNPVPKKVDKAYLVNGEVYKRPRLPRPKKWVTDHLYQYLWKRMEPKYKLETRLQSEKFVRRLSEACDDIAKRKSYKSYRDLLHALMKEMARLEIVSTRFDFYNFCHDFLPYELRAKMVPILLPGNTRTIPYDPKKLYDPLISP